MQARLPIWIGGGGEKVTLRIAAQHADGWNVPFIPPDDVGAQGRRARRALRRRSGRDPATITKTVNVGMAFTDEELKRQFGRDVGLREAGRAVGQRAGDGRQGRRLRRAPARSG